MRTKNRLANLSTESTTPFNKGHRSRRTKIREKNTNFGNLFLVKLNFLESERIMKFWIQFFLEHIRINFFTFFTCQLHFFNRLFFSRNYCEANSIHFKKNFYFNVNSVFINRKNYLIIFRLLKLYFFGKKYFKNLEVNISRPIF